MTSIELQLCDIQGRLFQLSARRGISSAEIIKVFMKSATAKAWILPIIGCNGQGKNIFWKKLSMKRER